MVRFIYDKNISKTQLRKPIAHTRIRYVLVDSGHLIPHKNGGIALVELP